MRVTNRTAITLYAIMYDERCTDKVGSAVAITSGTNAKVSVPSNKPSPYIKSLHHIIDDEPGAAPDELVFHPDGNPRTEIKVFIGATLKKLLPDYLEEIFEIRIVCPVCDYERPVDQIIVPTCVGPKAAGFLNKPIICWSCHDEPRPTENETVPIKPPT